MPEGETELRRALRRWSTDTATLDRRIARLEDRADDLARALDRLDARLGHLLIAVSMTVLASVLGLALALLRGA